MAKFSPQYNKDLCRWHYCFTTREICHPTLTLHPRREACDLGSDSSTLFTGLSGTRPAALLLLSPGQLFLEAMPLPPLFLYFPNSYEIIYASRNYLLRTYYESDTVLGTEGTTVNRTEDTRIILFILTVAVNEGCC